MENMTCKSCGGSVRIVGDSYVCDNCQSKWPIDGEQNATVAENSNESKRVSLEKIVIQNV